ncbi:hypothetical protein BU23DRAFT_9709 [Bimuria novae-zelandiae CBS 107.79]|uniref:F-box domain-containing protein n=1 Tax=Bimuria novae-zelandiae CBS 107.79 TaxID=1447943 RepID=A0A6A5W088_9PLEO|nr:hypothetical protein BU23DRAFT_9709 [Bimuria novae-zelandiae CBS 107.79]
MASDQLLDRKVFRFTSLPRELRNRIYGYVCPDLQAPVRINRKDQLSDDPGDLSPDQGHLALTRVNRQIRAELHSMYMRHVLVKWHEATAFVETFVPSNPTSFPVSPKNLVIEVGVAHDSPITLDIIFPASRMCHNGGGNIRVHFQVRRSSIPWCTKRNASVKRSTIP